jgi:ribosomal protein L7/L12
VRKHNSETENTVNSVEDRALLLYKKLLDIMKRENSETGEIRLDHIEHYMSQKIEILKEVEELTTDGQWIKNAKTHKELSGIIKQIIDLNDANAHTVRKIKSEINEELSSLQKSRSAFKAYYSQK